MREVWLYPTICPLLNETKVTTFETVSYMFDISLNYVESGLPLRYVTRS